MPLPAQTPALAGLPPYVFAELDRLKQEARADGREFIDLGIGSPDQPTPPSIVEALQRAAAEPSLHGYPPFRGARPFLDAAAGFMADRFGVTVDPTREVVALSGAKEGIAHLLAAYCGPGDCALVASVYYPVYARAALLNGAGVHYLPVTAPNFVVDLEHLPGDVLARAKVLIVNYPNNPTGAVADRAFYEKAVAFARRHRLVLLSDLAYSELTFDGFVAPSVLEVDGARDAAVEFHSCSKAFNMAGLRIGFATGNAKALDTLLAYRTNVGYGTPWVAQAAATHALANHRALTPPLVAEYQARRDVVYGALAAAGWNVTPPRGAMYAWLPVPDGFEDWAWVRALLDQAGVVVTPGVAFGDGGRGWFRVSYVAPRPVLADAVERMIQVARRA